MRRVSTKFLPGGTTFGLPPGAGGGGGQPQEAPIQSPTNQHNAKYKGKIFRAPSAP